MLQKVLDANYRVWGVDAFYYPDTGDRFLVRIIPNRSDDVSDFSGTRVRSETCRFTARCTQLPDPQKGARLDIGDERYTIKNKPVILDAYKLEWSIECHPLA